jgi:hypothetical protein
MPDDTFKEFVPDPLGALPAINSSGFWTRDGAKLRFFYCTDTTKLSAKKLLRIKT